MSRLPTADLDDLSEEYRAPLDVIRASNGYIPNSYRILAHRPEILMAFMALSKAVIRDEGTLDRGFRFLVAYISSSTAGCQFCQAHNIQSAARWGVPEEKLNAIWDYEESPLFTEAERAAFDLARGASLTPNATTDADIERLKAHFTTPQIVEILSVISLFGWLNRFNDTLRTALEEHNLDWAEAFGLHEKSAWDPAEHLPEGVDPTRFAKA
ncbi:peroxidase-related enzyme [Roseibacterium sp. SDUM158016]|uniref:carboxymuconolactone decarboxylase family protein n=1 Tax=Roseicyclus sediminis TaxID=2980997 RepID=UPI0021D2E307|nr:peroxidase-related enzyme [Roseibacterium sp. SDUM158016]MCU4652747.1 peroxidase-related enzyme [Roseibacterium sp. SDUM158016]